MNVSTKKKHLDEFYTFTEKNWNLYESGSAST